MVGGLRGEGGGHAPFVVLLIGELVAPELLEALLHLVRRQPRLLRRIVNLLLEHAHVVQVALVLALHSQLIEEVLIFTLLLFGLGAE